MGIVFYKIILEFFCWKCGLYQSYLNVRISILFYPVALLCVILQTDVIYHIEEKNQDFLNIFFTCPLKKNLTFEIFHKKITCPFDRKKKKTLTPYLSCPSQYNPSKDFKGFLVTSTERLWIVYLCLYFHG